MPVLYHYTCHSAVRQIRRSGQLNPSEGHFGRTGVWLTGLAPSLHNKREILSNNYDYQGETAERKLYRAACYVEVNLPPDMVEDLSHVRSHPKQDLWIWPDGPLVLSKFQHSFGVMEGTEDPYLRDRCVLSQRS